MEKDLEEIDGDVPLGDRRNMVFSGCFVTYGRARFLVTATGMNIARLVVEKWNDGGTDCVLNKNEVFWHHVPAQVAFTYTEDKDLVARAKALKAQGKEACSLLYKPDLLWNPVRYACVLEQLRRQFKKFKTYYPVHK